MLRSFARGALRTSQAFPRHNIRVTRALATNPPSDHHDDSANDEDNYDVNLLEGKDTRKNVYSALQARSADAIRYEYFAEQAELEAEFEAASLFRSLLQTAKQQSMGYMELIEQHGDGEFADTLQNLEASAERERNNAERALREHAVVAGREELEVVEEYFEDMADAAERVTTRLELAASMYDLEGMEAEIEEHDAEVPDKAKQ